MTSGRTIVHHRITTLCFPSFSLLLALSPLACAQGGPRAELNAYGRVWTKDSARPLAQAVAVRGDTIVAAGDSAEVARLADPETRILANGRAMVAPGFMDGHLHFVDGGFQLANLDLRPANSPAEFIARLWYLQTVRGKNDRSFDLLRQWRGSILLRRGEPGPISLGYRVFAAKDDDLDDYQAIVYKKGAWVVHMLRILMLDLKTMNEDRFAGGDAGVLPVLRG